MVGESPHERETPVCMSMIDMTSTKRHVITFRREAFKSTMSELQDAEHEANGLEIAQDLTKDPYKLYINGISETTTRDGLLAFLELVSGKDVEHILFGKDFNAMVEFKETPDLEKVQRKCKERALNGSHLRVEEVGIHNCVKVSGLGPKTTHDTILYYFENHRKSGGGIVNRVEYTEGDTIALVFFENMTDAENVVNRKHELNGSKLEVVNHNPAIGETTQDPQEWKKTKHVSVVAPTMTVISKYFYQEFQNILRENNLRCITEHGTGVIVLSPIDNTVGQDNWDESCKVIEAYIDDIVTNEVAVPPDAWQDISTHAKITFQSVTNADIVYKDEEESIVMRGKKNNVCEIAAKLKGLIEEILYERNKINHESQLSNYEFDLLVLAGFHENLRDKYRDLEVTMDDKDFVVRFRGPKSLVQEGALCVWKTVSKIKQEKMSLSKSIVKFLKSEAGCKFLEEGFSKRAIIARINFDDGDETSLSVIAITKSYLEGAKDLIKSLIAEEKIPLDCEHQSLLAYQNIESVLRDFNTTMVIVEITNHKTLLITGATAEVHRAKQNILNFFEENKIIQKTIETGDAGRAMLIRRYMQTEIKDIERSIDQSVVKIFLEDNYNNILIHGTKKGIVEASKKVSKLLKQIKEQTIELDTAGIKKLFSEGKLEKSRIENDLDCVIEICTTDTPEKLNVVSSPAQRICSYVTPEKKEIILCRGDLTKSRVDIMVNTVTKRLEHYGRLSKDIVEKGGKKIPAQCKMVALHKGDLHYGSVELTAPGNLACKRIAHAVGPVWGTWNKGGTEDLPAIESLRKTVTNSLDQAKHFTSIGMPAISTGVFGFPADLCAKATIESILEFSKKCPGTKLSKIAIVDMNDDVIKAFTKEMRTRFRKKRHFIDGAPPVECQQGKLNERKTAKQPRKEFTMLEETQPSTSTNETSQSVKIKLVIGDIASQKVDAIVNTVSEDLDLSRNACAKALSDAAGPKLQKKCRGIGNLPVGSMVATEGFNLKCKNVFHVAADKWDNGQGEQVLRSLVSACLEKAHKQGFSSIAFPAIGTGNLGFPRNVVANVFFEAVEFFEANNQQTSLSEVCFVLFHNDRDTIGAFEEEQKIRSIPQKTKLRSKPIKKDEAEEEHLSETESEVSEEEFTDDDASFFINSVHVNVVRGEITKQSTDAIITLSNTDLDMLGSLGSAIEWHGGSTIHEKCKQAGEQEPGRVVFTPAGKLPSERVIHLIPESDKLFDLQSALLKGLREADAQAITSIAIPPLGIENISTKKVAKMFADVVKTFCKENPGSVNHIRIVIFLESMFQDFYKAIEKVSKKSSSLGAFLWSRLKGVIMGTNSGSQGQDTLNQGRSKLAGAAKFDPTKVMSLRVLAPSKKVLENANSAITKLIKDQLKTKTIENTAVEGLTEAQEERILRLQAKYFTEIDIHKNPTRIIINGIAKDVSDTACAIYEILNEKTEQKYAELVSKTVQWFYVKNNDEMKYDDETNARIEQAYSDKLDMITFSLIDEEEEEQQYKIDFASMMEVNRGTSETIQVVRKDLSIASSLPASWAQQPKDENGKEKDFYLQLLCPNKHKQEYDDVMQRLNGRPSSNIVKIERVQNPELYRAYMVKKRKMDEKHGSNEMKLFHGTAAKNCDLINHKGFNRSYAGQHATAYGKGVYFAREVSYSMRPIYSPPDASRNRYIYLASVLVGQYTQGNNNMIVPPPKNPRIVTDTYDTTVDDPHNPDIFVAYHDNQVYPEYLITFK